MNRQPAQRLEARPSGQGPLSEHRTSFIRGTALLLHTCSRSLIYLTDQYWNDLDEVARMLGAYARTVRLPPSS